MSSARVWLRMRALRELRISTAAYQWKFQVVSGSLMFVARPIHLKVVEALSAASVSLRVRNLAPAQALWPGSVLAFSRVRGAGEPEPPCHYVGPVDL